MKPTEAGTDRYSPLTNRPTMPPIDANGSTVMISAAKRTDENSRNSRKKIAAIVTGTMIVRWLSARSMFWNCAAPFEVVALRQLDLLLDLAAQLGDEAAEVAVLHVDRRPRCGACRSRG